MKNDYYSRALRFIVLLGFVSLFGDITYEGARSIIGPYLALLGASAAVVGLVGGIGEFLGYAVRLASGYIADRTKAYWPLTILGYGLLCAIPLMVIADYWQLAALFIIIERIGKGVRAPARDVILSHATKQVGRGFGFGIHEALDQIGAIIGPIIFSAVVFYRGSYRDGFLILWIPVFFCLAVLLIARIKVPSPVDMEADDIGAKETDQTSRRLPPIFWYYSLFTFLSVAGLINFQIISYHFKVQTVILDSRIPLFYAVAMGVDAVIGLVVGRIYDRIGLITLVSIPLLTFSIPLLTLSSGPYLALMGMVLWGATMGIHETIMRAAVADLTEIVQRGRAYGIFNTVYGGAWFLGSAVMGFLYDYSIAFLVLFVVVMEAISIRIFFILRRTLG
jgi:MFS family permease